MSGPLWTISRVTLGRRLRDVTLALERGVTAVLGHSGAGKTSLLNLLVGFEEPDSGSVTVHFDRGARTRPLFWAPQDDGLWPHLTAREHLAAMGSARADELLEEFELSGRAAALPRVLSRGERARLAAARAVAADAAVLVMDEPLAHVDPSRTGKYWRVLRRHLDEAGASLVFATHAPETVLGEARQVICLKEGAVLYAGGVGDLYGAPATAELAACMGEANWLEPDEARLWLQREEAVARCFRPEQVQVRPAADGPLIVEDSRFRGAVAEVVLRHASAGAVRRFWHRPAGGHLAAGARVLVEVAL